MHVSDFIICEQVQYDPTGKPVIVVPLSVLQPLYIPAAINIGVSIGITEFELGNYAVTIYNERDMNKPLMVIGPINVSIAMRNANIPNEFSEVRISGEVRNLEIENEGKYIFILSFDGKEIDRKIVNAYSVKKYEPVKSNEK